MAQKRETNHDSRFTNHAVCQLVNNERLVQKDVETAEELVHPLDRGVFGNVYGLYTLATNALHASFEQYTEANGPTRLWRIALPTSG